MWLSVFPCDDLSKGFGAALLSQRHQEIERYIESKGFAYTFLRPTWFYQNFECLGGQFIKEKIGLQIPFDDAPANHTDACNVGKAAVIALAKPGHENKVYEFTGNEYGR